MILIIVLIALIIPIWTPAPVRGQIGVSITLSAMSPQSKEVVVTPDSIGSAQFQLTATVDMPSLIPMTVMVQFDGSTSPGWSATVSPQTVPFEESGTVNVTVTVVVPQATNAAIIGHVMVEAYASYPGGSKTTQSNATVTVRQYYRFQPQSIQSFATTTNDTLDFVLDIYNRGNGDDRFEIELTNRVALDAEGFTIALNQTRTGTVHQDEYASVSITVSYDGSKRPFKDYLNFVVTSLKAKEAGLALVKTYILVAKFDPSPSLGDFLHNPFRQTTLQNYIITGVIATTIICVVVAVVVKYRLSRKKRLKGVSVPKSKDTQSKSKG
jgi:hypothetical protein